MLDKAAIAATLEENRTTLAALGVDRLYLFGSYLSGAARKRSDIDFVLDYSQNRQFDLLDLIGVQLELKKIFKKKIDLLTRNGIHPALKQTILGQMETIYEN